MQLGLKYLAASVMTYVSDLPHDSSRARKKNGKLAWGQTRVFSFVAQSQNLIFTSNYLESSVVI